MPYFTHPYPRYGLAAVLNHNEIDLLEGDEIPDREILAKWTAEYLRNSLESYRLFTETEPSDEHDTTLKYEYVAGKDLATTKSAGQTSENHYYLAPHIATGDISANRLIGEVRKMIKKLEKGVDLDKSTALKRSFSPFTTKINEGTKSLSNPKTTLFNAVFTMVATLTEGKAAAQIDFTNQVIIPDIPLCYQIEFIQILKRVRSQSSSLLTRELKAGRRNFRPPIFEGNYPDAPPSPLFGPLGLIAAMGSWQKTASYDINMKPVMDSLADAPIYLVSYDSGLFKQTTVSHHAVRLALDDHISLVQVLLDLYRAQFYQADYNKPDNPTRNLFYSMAARFLQQYTDAAFKDFLAFRLQYNQSLKPIFEDYFMSQKTISKEDIDSAASYGSHLNFAAWLVAKQEKKKDENGNSGSKKSESEYKSRALAQLESVVMSSKSPSELTGRINTQVGRLVNYEIPFEAQHFIKRVNTGEIDLKTAQNIILSFMRVRSDKTKKDNSDENLLSLEEIQS